MAKLNIIILVIQLLIMSVGGVYEVLSDVLFNI